MKLSETNVYAILEGIMRVESMNPYDNSHYEIMFCFDKGEIFESEQQVNIDSVDLLDKSQVGANVFESNYVLIRTVDAHKPIIKLWGWTRKNQVVVECSKSTKKRNDFNVAKKLYTSKKLDKNDNYICDSNKDAIALSLDFLSQCNKALFKETTATKAVESKKKAN